MKGCFICGNNKPGCWACLRMRPGVIRPNEIKLGPPEQFAPPAKPEPVRVRCPFGDPTCPCNDVARARPAPVKVQPRTLDDNKPSTPRNEARATSWRTLMERRDYTVGADIGRGAFATVHELKGDPTRVIKCTTDRRDAYVMELARRQQANGGCRNIVRIDHVWSLPAAESERGRTGCYAAVLERLESIPHRARDRLPPSDYAINMRYCELLAVARGWARGDGSIDRAYEGVTNGWTVAALNIKGICDDLETLGVTTFSDFHLGNVMIRPGDRMVLSDLGCSESPKPEIEELR